MAEVPAVVGRLLGERLELVEDLWLTVLRSECTPLQLERLVRLKELSEPPPLARAAAAAATRRAASVPAIALRSWP